MKKLAVLLNGPIASDGRVQRTINVMLEYFDVHLFYVNGKKTDREIFLSNKIKFTSFNYNHDKNKWFRKNFLVHNIYKSFEMKIKNLSEYDIVFCNDYPTLYYGYEAKKLNQNLILIYDSHEIFIETFNQYYPKVGVKGLIWSLILIGLKKYHSLKEKNFISKVDKMITVNESLQNHFKNKYGINAEPIYNVPYLDSNDSNVSIKITLGLTEDDIIILYQGDFNDGRGLKQLVETFTFLPANYHLVLIGDGILENELKKLVYEMNLINVHFVQKVSYENLHSYTKTADLGVFLLEPINLSKKLASANKIFEYMKAEIPFLTTNQPENKKIVANYNCGFLIDSISPKEVAKTIKEIFDYPNEYHAKSQNGKKGFLEKYNWEKEKKKLENIFNKIN